MTTTDLVVLSGGMDSTTLAYAMRAECDRLLAVSFDYGQRHRKELDYAARTCAALDAEHRVIDLSVLREHLHGSALTDDSVPVPEGHYAAPSMSATVVPNRNMVMLSIACAVAVAEHARRVGTAVHAGDHPIYPDCRPDFIDAVQHAARLGTEGYADPELTIFAPFVHWSKDQIADEGDVLGVEWRDTWSCYQGGELHCGRCGTCVERIEAFQIAGVTDPTEYDGSGVIFGVAHL